MSGIRNTDGIPHFKKIKGNVWLDDETEILIQLFIEDMEGAPNYGKHRPLESYMSISKKLKEIGYNRSPHQIRNKIKQLRTTYLAAKRGSESDRQQCFMYDDLQKCFKDVAQSFFNSNDDSTQMSSDEQLVATDNSPAQKRRRQYEEAMLPVNETEFFDVMGSSQNDIFADYDENAEFPSTSDKKPKKPRITTTTNIERVSVDDHAGNDLIEFMSDQLEKQRLHQIEITKIFTDAMSDQFKKFSELITNLTQQMSPRQSSMRDENKTAELLHALTNGDSNSN